MQIHPRVNFGLSPGHQVSYITSSGPGKGVTCDHSLRLVTQARFPASLEKSLLMALVFWGAARRRGNVMIPFSHSPHPSLQAINSRLVFKAVTLWLTNNNDSDDSNEGWTSCLWSGEETEDTVSWTLGYRVISLRNANTALVFKVLLFLGGKKKLLVSGSQDNELGAKLCYFFCLCYFC